MTRPFEVASGALALVLLSLPACAARPSVAAAPATSKWELVSCQLNNMGCRTESLHATSGECEKAKDAYRKENPARTAGCMKKP